MKHRNTHYWLWFIFFGIVAGVIYFLNHHDTIDSESTWLLVAGALGLLFGARWLNEGKLSRTYDLIVGIIFTAVGLVGILLAFHIPLIPPVSGALASYVNTTTIFGLSLGLLPALIHTVLGLTSLNHGIRNE
ncbi:MAG: hypothetical protein ABI068_05025 [Ktedonobacterales bacterium]